MLAKTAVGSTVNVADASYTNTIGDPLLTAHSVDPDFDPDQRASYYVRVIEIPKPRWTAYDAKFFKVKMLDPRPHHSTKTYSFASAFTAPSQSCGRRSGCSVTRNW
jgi:hypothetical protein